METEIARAKETFYRYLTLHAPDFRPVSRPGATSVATMNRMDIARHRVLLTRNRIIETLPLQLATQFSAYLFSLFFPLHSQLRKSRMSRTKRHARAS
jgi:hypothetical protein